MININVVSIIPYKVLPANLGGEKGIAIFNEYLGKLIPITAVSTRNNEAGAAKNYTLLNILSNNRIRYLDPFLYLRLRKIILQKKATHLLIEHPYYGWLAWLLKKTLPVTWVVHSHNIEYMRSQSIGRRGWRTLKRYETWVYRNSDINFFISESDMHFAVENLKVDASKSYPVTFGVEHEKLSGDLDICRRQIRSKYLIPDDQKILLFNGALYHHTNYDALTVILEKINPILMKAGLQYRIIVCGKGLPAFFKELIEYKDKNIIYAGFVDDISIYFKAADIFLNPILKGGGVKTKAIEALAMNCTVISTETGAEGLKREVCGNKLQVVADDDWQRFAQLVIQSIGVNENIPATFFEYYYWGNIVKRVMQALSEHAP